jgi:hypothetical protein
MKKNEKVDEKQFTVKAPAELHESYVDICKKMSMNMSQRIRNMIESDLKKLTEKLEKGDF